MGVEGLEEARFRVEVWDVGDQVCVGSVDVELPAVQSQIRGSIVELALRRARDLQSREDRRLRGIVRDSLIAGFLSGVAVLVLAAVLSQLAGMAWGWLL